MTQNAGRVPMGIGERRLVLHGPGVEDRGEVGGRARLDDPAIPEAQPMRAHPGHLAHGRLQREELALARILAEHAREGAVHARVGLAWRGGGPGRETQRVRADHDGRMGQHPGHVVRALRERHHGDGGPFLDEQVHHGLGRRRPRPPGQRGQSQLLHLALGARRDLDLVEPHRAHGQRPPALAVHQALFHDVPARGAIGDALQQTRRAAVVDPGRQKVVHLVDPAW